ncbi:hypothetical protein [Limibacillus halophilus]
MSAAGGPPQGPVRDLPLEETVKETYASVFSNFRVWLRLALIPALLLLAIWELAFMGVAEEGAIPVEKLTGILLPLTLLSLAPISLFGYSWLRLMLLGPQEARGLLPGDPGSALRFFFTFVQYIFFLLGFLFIAIFALSALLNYAGIGLFQVLLFLQLPLALGSVWFLLRLGMALAARAAGESYRFKNSWAQTRGQNGRLILAGLATLIPVQIAAQGIALVLPQSLASEVFLALLTFLPFAFFFSLLAVVFKKISGWVPPA